MKHIKIILVPDAGYPGPSGCAACHYKPPSFERGCREPLAGQRRGMMPCLSKSILPGQGGVFEHGGYWTIKASVSRNKREGKYRQRYWRNLTRYGTDEYPVGFARGHRD